MSKATIGVLEVIKVKREARKVAEQQKKEQEKEQEYRLQLIEWAEQLEKSEVDGRADQVYECLNRAIRRKQLEIAEGSLETEEAEDRAKKDINLLRSAVHLYGEKRNAKLIEEAERLAKLEAEGRAKEESERLMRVKQEKLIEEAERLAKLEAEGRAKEESERLMRVKQEKLIEEAEQLAKLEAEGRAKEEEFDRILVEHGRDEGVGVVGDHGDQNAE